MTPFECLVIWAGAAVLAVPIIAGWLRYRRIEQEREEQAALRGHGACSVTRMPRPMHFRSKR